MRRIRRALVLTIAVMGGACRASRPTEPTLEDLTHARSADERIDVLARKCARIASCAHPHDAPRLRDPRACVDDWLERLGDPQDPVPECLSLAASCGDIDACLHGTGDPRAAELCAARPGLVTACDGNALVACASDDVRESTLTPCGPLGATCGETRSAGGLVEHGCLSPGACPANATHTRCDGDAAVIACHDQIEERVVCKPGTACRAHKDEDGEELATCEEPTEVRCDVIGARTCRGSMLVRCEAHGHHGHEHPVDCAALGLVCGDVAGRATCTTGETPCAGGAPRCDRSRETLSYCAAGRVEHVVCDDLGLGACETDGNGPVALCGAGHARARTR